MAAAGPENAEAVLRAVAADAPEDFEYIAAVVRAMAVKGAKPTPVTLPPEWDTTRKARVFEAMCALGFTPAKKADYRFKAPAKGAVIAPASQAFNAVSSTPKGKQAVASSATEAEMDLLVSGVAGMGLATPSTPDASAGRPSSSRRRPVVESVVATPPRSTPVRASAASASRGTPARGAAAAGVGPMGHPLMSPAQHRASQAVEQSPAKNHRAANKATAIAIGKCFMVENESGASGLDIICDMDNALLLLEFEMDAEDAALAGAPVSSLETTRQRMVIPFECVKQVNQDLGSTMFIQFGGTEDVVCYTWNEAWSAWSLCDETDVFQERVTESLSLDASVRVQFAKVDTMRARLKALQGAILAHRRERIAAETGAAAGGASDAPSQADGSMLDFYGDYRLGGSLGSGAFAEVSVATKTSTREKFAVKVMKTRKLNARTLEGVLLEFDRAKSAGGHANIAKMFAMYGSPQEGTLVLVQELCVGGELFDRIIDMDGIPENDCRVIMRQLLSAVGHLHQLGFIHRDLKPENIMFKKKGGLEIRLIDFGIGRNLKKDPASNGGRSANERWKERLRNRVSMQQASGSAGAFGGRQQRQMSLQAAQTICGTHEYMAPEVWTAADTAGGRNREAAAAAAAAGEGHDHGDGKECGYGTSCDVWSCGVILFAMLSASPAFAGDNPAEIRDAVLRAKPNFRQWPFHGPASDDTIVSKLCVPFIERMFIADPHKRPGAAALLTDAWLAADEE